MKMVCKARKKK